jgi:hypothetical protein
VRDFELSAGIHPAALDASLGAANLDTMGTQLVVFRSRGAHEISMLALARGEQGDTLVISAASTAEALAMLHPLISTIDPAEARSLAAVVRSAPSFGALEAAVAQALRSSPNNLLAPSTLNGLAGPLASVVSYVFAHVSTSTRGVSLAAVPAPTGSTSQNGLTMMLGPNGATGYTARIENSRKRWIAARVSYSYDGAVFESSDAENMHSVAGLSIPVYLTSGPDLIDRALGNHPSVSVSLRGEVPRARIRVFGFGVAGWSNVGDEAPYVLWPTYLTLGYDVVMPTIEAVLGVNLAGQSATKILRSERTVRWIKGTIDCGEAAGVAIPSYFLQQGFSIVDGLWTVAGCTKDLLLADPTIVVELAGEFGVAVTSAQVAAAVPPIHGLFALYQLLNLSTTVYAILSSDVVSEFTITDPAIALSATLQGRVFNAASGGPVAGATIAVRTTSGVLVAQVLTDGAGNWNATRLPPATYRIDASATGFVATAIVSQPLTVPITVVEPIPLVALSPTPGGISGSIRSATTNALITASTSVELRSGMNALTGTPLATVTGSSGSFQFSNVGAGVYTVVAHATGFTDGSRTGIVVGGGVIRSGQDVLLSPSASGSFARVVLSWGATPSDLDSHMTGPVAGQSARSWVYWNSKGTCTISPFTCLDIDDTDSFGPETITISQVTPGTYRYYVYDYSNRFATSSTALSLSGATVRFFVNNNLVQSYFVPPGVGNAWGVFEWNGQTATTVNQLYTISGVPTPADAGLAVELSPFEAELRSRLQGLPHKGSR